MPSQTATDTPETAFTAALVRFQADIPHIGKDQTANTGTYSYSYADLSDITHTCLPLLAAHDLAWTVKTAVTDSGFMLLASLKHSAGWSETCEWPLPDPSRSSAQQVGSALTYARRYTFTALTGVAPGGEDDDAQAAAVAAPSPLVAAKNAVWEQAQRLGWDKDQLIERYAQDNEGQAIDAAKPAALHRWAKQLAALGANGLPLNKDGSVARRKTTEEQRTDAGLMSDEERKAHKALVDTVTKDEKKAKRSGPPADLAADPWANVEVAVPGGGE